MKKQYVSPKSEEIVMELKDQACVIELGSPSATSYSSMSLGDEEEE